MSLLTAIDQALLQEIEQRLARGLGALGVPDPLTLNEWATEHFYLSAESSYVEQQWTPWPFQRAILALFSNDDVREISLKKSARVGYTKMLLAGLGYFAEHKRRNQALWQPTDSDAEDFVKSELNPMLRDVAIMRRVFPTYLQRHTDNTLTQKRFIGSVLRVLGGKAAKNYRRISIDRAWLDELSQFDRDIEKQGSARKLAGKRLVGATFPQLVSGSSPLQKGFCLIDEAYGESDERFRYNIRCPQCQGLHPISWGGKDEPHGLKWEMGAPETVYHLCPHCTYPLKQSEYEDAAPAGVWVNDAGDLWLREDGTFCRPDGAQADAPLHVGLHVWAAYSPAVRWAEIVKEFADAYAKLQEGDDVQMKTFINLTRGEVWEGEIEKTDPDELRARAEPFARGVMPRGCLLLLCAMDTQDNRIEAGVWGLGIGGEMWSIDHKVFFGNPTLPEIWADVEEFLRHAQYPHVCGTPQRIFASAIDSGGHHADAVYAFAHRLKALRVHAIKGASAKERSIENGNARVSYKWNGRLEKHGPILWQVGTHLAQDRFQSRLSVPAPGPGYVHLCAEMSPEWFKQLAGADRTYRKTATGTESRWVPNRKRLEVRDCLAYAIWLEERLDLWHSRKAGWWKQLEAAVQPEGDLFVGAMDSRETQHATPGPTPAAVDSRGTQAKPRRSGWVDSN